MNIYSVASIAASLFCFILGTYVLIGGIGKKTRRTFGLASILTGIWTAFPFMLSVAATKEDAMLYARLLYFPAAFVPAAWLHFMTSIVSPERIPARRVAIAISYITGALISTRVFSDNFIRDIQQFAPHFAVIPGFEYSLFIGVFILIFSYVVVCVLLELKTATGSKRNQIRYILLAYILGLMSGMLHFGAAYLKVEPFPHDFLIIGYVGTMAYAIIRYRLMDTNLAITRATVFMVVYAAVLGLPLLAALSWRPQLEQFLGPNWWVGLWIVCSVLATAAHYANLYLQQRAGNRLLAEQRRYQSILRQASQGMTLIKELGRLLRLIVHLLTSTVRIKHAAIYLWDERTKQFIPATSRQWKVKDPPSFAPQDPLIEFLYWHRVPLVTEELQMQVENELKELRPILDSLKALDAAVIIPSFVEDQCQGLLLLGAKNSGALYTQDDLQVFQVLASQAALAIENAQFYEELKRTQADLFQTAKMASLGHMAGGMSHQINNRFHVLSILAGTLKSVLKDMDPTTLSKEKLVQFWNKTLETLNKVEENSLRGGDIVKTLLKFSRPSGEYKPTSVTKILSTAKEVVQFRVNFSLIDFTEEIPEGLPPVRGDLNQLADCCINLIANANDAIQKKAEMIVDRQLSPSSKDPTPFKGWLKIQARLEREGDKAWVILRLNDNGVGMTATEMENLFIPFFTTKATVQKGTGLGLYIIDRIMEQHGGRITATSEYGVGTTFVMRLPVYQETQKAEGSMQKAGVKR